MGTRWWHPARLLMAATPALVVAVLEFVRHHHLMHRMSMETGNWVTAGIAFIASFAVVNYMFGIVDRVRRDDERKRQRLAVFEERDRIASALHDGVSQSLFFANVKLAAAEDAIQRGDAARATAELSEGRFGVQAAHDDIRQAIFNLKLLENAPGTLTDTLAGYLEEHERQTGSKARLYLDCGEPDLDATARTQVLTIVQEALWNVRKHANASVVVVRCLRERSGYVFEVCDDGCGFDLDEPGRGFVLGMRIMQERAALGGGRLDVDTRPGRGTTVRVRMPQRSRPLSWFMEEVDIDAELDRASEARARR